MNPIIETIKEDLPKDAKITDITFEGSEIIVYTKSREFFNTSTELIKRIVGKIKKRIEVRADPSIIMDEEKTKEIIRKTVPQDAGIKDIYFEPEFARVVIHAEKPGLVIGKSGETLLSIKEATAWTPYINRAPVIDSEVIRSIRRMLHKEAGYRKKFLNALGEKIYTPGKEVEWIRLTALGAFREVGRSCILLQTPQSKVLLDCGMSVSAVAQKPYPYLDAPEFNIQNLDAVVISHAHMDHCLPPETTVKMWDGSAKNISDLAKGDEVLSIDWKTENISKGVCVGKTKTKNHKFIYRIKTAAKTIESSPNHRFFVLKDGKIGEAEAQELREGDLVPVLPKNFSTISETSVKSASSLLLVKHEGITWQKITSTEILENSYEELIDIEVYPHRNFIAEGIVVHNSGMVPFLYEWGYRGPLYCTRPTRDISALLHLDYLQICQRENKKPLYTSKGVEEAIKHCVPLEYDEVSDITPDMRLTLSNAGHLLGSSVCHVHIGDGLYNVLYSGDIKFERTKLFERTSADFTRAETVIIEGTYGANEDVMTSHKDGAEMLIGFVKRAINRGGRILIPSFAVGRSQDIITILTESDIDCPIYLDGMLWDATAIHTAYPEFMAPNIQNAILHKGRNPFTDERLKGIGSQRERQEVFDSKHPCVVLSTSGMLMGGPAIEYLKNFASEEKNMLCFVGYQAEGSPGRRIQKGWKQIQLDDGRMLDLKLEIETVRGLSGHSDQRQLLNYIQHLNNKPRRVIVNHCENSKCVELARTIHKTMRIESVAPKNLETIRLR